MNRKQLLILVVLVALVGGLAIVTSNRNKTSWESVEKPVSGTILKDFPLNDVTEILIKDKDASLTLVKKDERWTVKERNHYPANFDEIGAFLRKVWDLKPAQQPKVGESQLGRLELVEPGKGDKSGTLVEFKGAGGKALGALILGKKHMREGNAQFGGGSFPDGRYLMIPGKLDSIALVSESFNDIEPKAVSWLAKEFFKVEKLKAVSVKAEGKEAWDLARETEGGEWKLAGLKAEEKLEPSATGGFNFLLSSPGFTDVVAEAAELKNPVKASLETFDGFKYEVTIAPKEGAEDYLLKLAVSANLAKERTPGKDEKPEDKAKLDKEFKDKLSKWEEKLKQEKQFEGHTYLVGKFTVDALLKERKDFIAKPEEAKAETEKKP
jgi:hypothetical protein